MYCKFCGFENEDGTVYCSACGKRIDGKIECPKCHQLTNPGNFCTVCGTPLDGRIRCPKCGEVYEGNFCPKCGAQAPGMEKRREVFASSLTDRGLDRDTRDALETVEPVISESVADDAPGDGEKRKAKTRRNLTLCSSILGILAVLSVFVFTFFTGVTARGSSYGVDVVLDDFGSGKINLYHFFYRAYANISGMSSASYASLGRNREVACYGVAVLGTIVSVCMILVMAFMVYRCCVKIYRTYKYGDTLSNTHRTAVFAYFLYVAFVLMFRSLLYEYYEYDGLLETSAVVDLNGATIAGLIVGGVFVGASFILDLFLYAGNGGKLKISKTIASIVLAAVLITAVCLLSLSAGFRDVDGGYREVMIYGYLKQTIYGYTYAMSDNVAMSLLAQIFAMVTIFLSCLAAARLLASATDATLTATKPLIDVFTVICAVLTLVFGIFSVRYAMDYLGYESSAGMSSMDFAVLIAGFVLCIVYFIASLATRKALRCPKEEDGGDEDVLPS